MADGLPASGSSGLDGLPASGSSGLDGLPASGSSGLDGLPGRPVALITGPTSGLGAGFARKYAALGYDLVLVARDEKRLGALADELTCRYGINAEVLAADLGQDADRAKVAERVSAGISVLVNNAGFGTAGEFWIAAPELLKSQLDVNVTAVMELTRAALPAMIEAGTGTVINVASVAGLLSGRGSTYSASKAWVVSFSEGLANGLEGTGVGMHVLCPGFVHTEFHERAGIAMESIPEFFWLNVDDVVSTCLADVAAGKVLSVPGVQYKVMTGLGRVIPRGLVRRVNKMVGRGRGRT